MPTRILLSGREDDDIQDYFIRTAFPPAHQMDAVFGVFERANTATLPFLETQENIPRRRLESIVKLLEVDGAIARDRERPGTYFRTRTPWSYDKERVERVTALREVELEQMREYMRHTGCLMQFLTTALDDPRSEPCGRCMNCRGVPPPTEVSEALVVRAVEFLRRSCRVINPRLLWPAGAVDGLRGRISEPNEPGWALSIYGDAGWGRHVADAKYGSQSFGPDLIEAAAQLIRERWNPSAAEGWWVTSIPSRRRTRLVADATEAVAKAPRLAVP